MPPTLDSVCSDLNNRSGSAALVIQAARRLQAHHFWRPSARGKEAIDAEGDGNLKCWRSVAEPAMAHAKKERAKVFGTDQRITSGPAAKTAPHSKAGYMAAPNVWLRVRFLLHCGRRPYIAPFGTFGRYRQSESAVSPLRSPKGRSQGPRHRSRANIGRSCYSLRASRCRKSPPHPATT
jgi:hypothetical protein